MEWFIVLEEAIITGWKIIEAVDKTIYYMAAARSTANFNKSITRGRTLINLSINDIQTLIHEVNFVYEIFIEKLQALDSIKKGTLIEYNISIRLMDYFRKKLFVELIELENIYDDSDVLFDFRNEIIYTIGQLEQ